MANINDKCDEKYGEKYDDKQDEKSLDNRRLLGLGRVGNRWSSLVTRTSLGLNSCYTFTTLFPHSIQQNIW